MIHQFVIVFRAYLFVLYNKRCVMNFFGKRFAYVHIPIHMQEGFCLHGVGFDFRIRPMLGQTQMVIIDHMYGRVWKV